MNGTFCKFLIKLPRLSYLSAGEHVTDDGLASIATLLRLRVLFLEGPFTDAGLPKIRTLKRVERLFITSDLVSDAGMAVITELPKLYRLGFDTPRFSDAGVATLSKCRNLTAITEIRSNISAKGRRLLRMALPNCDLDLLDKRHRHCSDDNE